MLRCAIHPFTYRGEGILLHLLKEIETLLQPENIISASDEELIRKVIPRSEYHLSEKQTDVLKTGAATDQGAVDLADPPVVGIAEKRQHMHQIMFFGKFCIRAL